LLSISISISIAVSSCDGVADAEDAEFDAVLDGFARLSLLILKNFFSMS
jgi:hypothetical protein